jgi:thiopeptide-type bacteriocin biosynthesis protein
MTYFFSDHLVLRMPVGTAADYGKALGCFLADKHFLSALYLASPVLFEGLERKGFDARNLSAKEELSLRKYINRYCFRPTPFGLFASVGLAEWGEGRVYSNDRFRSVIRPEQAFRYRSPDSSGVYRSNPTLYRVLDEYRFIRTAPDENLKDREYQLQATGFSKILKDLAAYCSTGPEQGEIVAFVVKAAGCSPEEGSDYVDFLIASQWLTDLHGPAITGPDNDIADQQGIPDLKTLSALTGHFGGRPSVVLHREPAGELLDQTYRHQLADGLFALAALSSGYRSPDMARFIKTYRQYFDGQQLPLLLALDPEAGVGYQQEPAEKDNPLMETLHIPVRTVADDALNWSAAHRLLLESWLGNGREIRLEEAALKKIAGAGWKTLGASVLFRVCGEQVFIESAGGCHAGALIGRFTVGDPAITTAARDLAQWQEINDPGVLYAEIVHLAGPRVDNINRREITGQYEIPLTATSVLPAANQIMPDDLYISIAGDQVLLFSKKHNKPVIPRLTSAYNQSLDRLPLFRFLADLPYQYGQADLSLDLCRYFPGLSYYPRVVYKNTILALATWILNEEQIACLREGAGEPELPDHFSLNEGDQQLVFNRKVAAEWSFFLQCITQKKQVTLKEYLPQKQARQYNAFVLPGMPSGLAGTAPAPPVKVGTKRKYIPGSEWLYLKIYTPRPAAERLLLQLRPLIRKKYAHGKVERWFFIRYEDHAPHIRLRLLVKPDDTGEILVSFKRKLETRIRQQVIREYQVDSYSRELERYAAAGIAASEGLFWASSELVLQYLARRKPAVPAYLFALQTTLTMIAIFLPQQAAREKFCLESWQQFLPEFDDRQLKYQLDRKYRELAPEIRSGLAAAATASPLFTTMLKQAADLAGEDNDYLRSIVHMHLNRVFTGNARQQEMVTYYLLYKYLYQEARLSLTRCSSISSRKDDL